MFETLLNKLFSTYKDSEKIICLRFWKKSLIKQLEYTGFNPYQDENDPGIYTNQIDVDKYSSECYGNNIYINYFDENYFRFMQTFMFFRYCYRFTSHYYNNDIDKLLSDKIRLELFKNHTGNYSPISAVILSSNELCKKRRFIVILLSYGFKITKHDKELSNLEVYENISINLKNNVMLFLANEKLLPELKIEIVQILIYKYYFDFSPTL